MSLCERWKKIDQHQTHQHADSVEAVPLHAYGLQSESDSRHLVAVGTYQLREQQVSDQSCSQIRDGSVLLYRVSAEGKAQEAGVMPLKSSGVFDLKWAPSRPLLAVASAQGTVELFSLAMQPIPSLSSLQTLALPSALKTDHLVCLAAGWDGSSGSCLRLAASHNQGLLAVHSLSDSSSDPLRAWTAHGDSEVWAVAFQSGPGTLLFSGADDGTLQGWDLRASPGSPSFCKRFEAGVTCLLPHSDPNLLVSGCYDQRVALWDLRNLRRALSSCETGGGVWRLKYHPSDPSYLITAAMRGGFHLLRQDADGQLSLASSHLDPHTSEGLCYGVDWIAAETVEDSLVGCCSFYDDLFSIASPF